MKQLESQTFIFILIFDENIFENLQRQSLFELQKAHISHIVHPFGEINRIIVFLILAKSRATHWINLFLAVKHKKLVEKFKRSK